MNLSPRRDKHGIYLISDALPFGRLWYDGPKAVLEIPANKAPTCGYVFTVVELCLLAVVVSFRLLTGPTPGCEAGRWRRTRRSPKWL